MLFYGEHGGCRRRHHLWALCGWGQEIFAWQTWSDNPSSAYGSQFRFYLPLFDEGSRTQRRPVAMCSAAYLPARHVVSREFGGIRVLVLSASGHQMIRSSRQQGTSWTAVEFSFALQQMAHHRLHSQLRRFPQQQIVIPPTCTVGTLRSISLTEIRSTAVLWCEVANGRYARQKYRVFTAEPRSAEHLISNLKLLKPYFDRWK